MRPPPTSDAPPWRVILRVLGSLCLATALVLLLGNSAEAACDPTDPACTTDTAAPTTDPGTTDTTSPPTETPSDSTPASSDSSTPTTTTIIETTTAEPTDTSAPSTAQAVVLDESQWQDVQLALAVLVFCALAALVASFRFGRTG